MTDLSAFLSRPRHIRSELRDGQQRPVNRTYYFIDYRQTIDAIKWRVYKMDKEVQGNVVPANEKKEYFCARCGAEWTQMEVLDKYGPSGFLCHRCNSVLKHAKENQSSEHQRSTRMHNQLKFITDLLLQIDSGEVPEYTFDGAFEKRRPVVRDATHQIALSTGVDPTNRPTAVKGLANMGPTKISVEISSTNGPSEEEKLAELARKEQVAKQNQLPAWIAQSTVSGASHVLDKSRAVPGLEAVDVKDDKLPGSADPTDDNYNIDEYYANMARSKEVHTHLTKEEEEGSEEEEEFEDVVGLGTTASTASPAGGVAASGPTVIKTAPSPVRQPSAKREASHGPGSEPSSPRSEDRPAKKVKLEEVKSEDKKVKVEEPDPADESDESIEFEDV